MKVMSKQNSLSKKLIAFDLDGTLAESKSKVDDEMTELLEKLLAKYKVCIISGGRWSQFERQLLSGLSNYKFEEYHSSGYYLWVDNIKNLFLMPASGTSLMEYRDPYNYHYDNDPDIEEFWRHVYCENLSPEECAKIYKSFYSALWITNCEFKEVHGNHIENRGSQITFSALGQDAPISLKKKWDPFGKKRKYIISLMDLPEFEVRFGGTTSIDVTKKGRDKAFGMNKICEHLKLKHEDVLFIGDALHEGGNDYAVEQMGIDCIETSGPEETKKIIKNLLRGEC